MNCALRIIAGLAVGGALGYGLSRLACAGGGCPLTSNRWLMLLLGAFLGVWLALSGCSRETAPAEQARQEQVAAGSDLTTAEQFQAQVVRPGKPALVDFYADWCGYCQALKPTLAQLESEYAGKVAFFRVDTDAARELSSQHGIQYLPTLLFYAGGRQVDRIVGLESESQLRQRLEQLTQER